MAVRRSILLAVAALLSAVILAGCGTASPSRQGAYAAPITNADVAESALQRLKAPPGFRRTTCTFLAKLPYTRCYRRNQFVPLNATRFARFITASGLTPYSNTVACPRFIRPRPGNPNKWDQCQARGSAASVEFSAFATSMKLRRVKPSDRRIAAKLRGTVFEVAVVEH